MKKNLYKTFLSLVCISIFAGPVMSAAVLPSGVTIPYSQPVTTDPVPAASLQAAFAEFKNLTRKEKKERYKNVKKELKEFKKEKRSGTAPSTNTALLVILAILLPPLAVYLHQGEINQKFWISLLLTLLFFLPGVIYALLVVLGEA